MGDVAVERPYRTSGRASDRKQKMMTDGFLEWCETTMLRDEDLATVSAVAIGRLLEQRIPTNDTFSLLHVHICSFSLVNATAADLL